MKYRLLEIPPSVKAAATLWYVPSPPRLVRGFRGYNNLVELKVKWILRNRFILSSCCVSSVCPPALVVGRLNTGTFSGFLQTLFKNQRNQLGCSDQVGA